MLYTADKQTQTCTPHFQQLAAINIIMRIYVGRVIRSVYCVFSNNAEIVELGPSSFNSEQLLYKQHKHEMGRECHD